jgi:digeranylgeranylglycerophospholipid reductase
MQDYDVIVVGAGPAGCAAARYAAAAGARTLLLDRRHEIGTPVRCGEFCPVLADIHAAFPRSGSLDELAAAIEVSTRLAIRESIVVSPWGRRTVVPLAGVVIDRGAFDRALAASAASAGAEVLPDTRVTGVDGLCVVTSRGTLSARVVIGADGPLSVVARDAGLPRVEDAAFGLQHVMAGVACDPATVEMHFGGLAPGGYAWVIPRGDGTANVGIGVRPAREAGLARSALDAFVRMLERRGGRPVARLRSAAKWIPVGGPLPVTVRGNVILAGDAAGQVIASNGGGIPTAAICGRIAGETAASHVRGRCALEDYERRWREALGAELGRALTTRRIFDVVSAWHPVQEAAMLLAGAQGIRNLMTCRPWYRTGPLA